MSSKKTPYYADMKQWLSIIVPAELLFLFLILSILDLGLSQWADAATFRGLPYVLLGITGLLGLLFSQSRIAFMAFFLGVVTALVDWYYFRQPQPLKGQTVVFLASLFIPALMTLFYHLPEHGMFNVHGGFRASIVFLAALVLLIYPQIIAADAMATTSDSLPRDGAGDWLQVPLTGMIAFGLAIPLLLIRKTHESPFLGSLLAISLVAIFCSLNFQSPLCRVTQSRAFFLLFMSGAAATLIWTVLESSWRVANLDDLTELPGRRALKRRLAGLGAAYGIAVLDIDNFKAINDRHGHATGDEVLRRVADHLRRCPVGQAFRYGGEEFVVVWESGDFQARVAQLEALRKAIAAEKIAVIAEETRTRKTAGAKRDGVAESRRTMAITVSIGVARSSSRRDAPQDVLEAADRALYQAKDSGRNCLKAAPMCGNL